MHAEKQFRVFYASTATTGSMLVAAPHAVGAELKCARALRARSPQACAGLRCEAVQVPTPEVAR